MGLRFRKRIRIAKGVNLNLSKSGVGISTGVKGARVGVGPRGAYRSLGIPGTGVYAFDYIGKKKKSGTQPKQNNIPQPPPEPTMPKELALPKYPTVILVLSLILIFLEPVAAILGLIIYATIRSKLQKSPLYLAHKQYSTAKLAQEKGNTKTALSAYLAVLEHKPEIASLYKTIADLYYEEEDFQKAAVSYEKYLSDHSNDYPPKIKFAVSLAHAGQLQKAISVLQSLPRELKDHIGVVTTLGAFFLEAGQTEMAVNTLERGPTRKRTMDADLMLFRYTLGLAYKESGHTKKAIKQFQKVYVEDIYYMDIQEQLDSLSS